MLCSIKSYNLYLITALIILTIVGCEGPQGPTGPTGTEGRPGAQGQQGSEGPKMFGSISGFVKLLDINGALLKPSNECIVSIGGTSKTVNCDSTGRWTIDSIQTGTIDIVFSKTGFGTHLKHSYQFVGGANVFYGSISLVEIPNYSVVSLTSSLSQNQIIVTGNISIVSPQNYNSFVRIFIGTDSTVNSNPSKYITSFSGYANIGTSSFSISIGVDQLKSLSGFISGDKVYFRSYGCSAISAYDGIDVGSYIDPSTGRRVYTSLSSQSSPISNIILP